MRYGSIETTGTSRISVSAGGIERSRPGGVDSAVLVGGELTRRLIAGFGAFALRVRAGVPISARPLDGAQGSTGDGLAGYLRVVLDWAW